MILVRPRTQNNGEGVVLSRFEVIADFDGCPIWRETVGEEPLLQKSDFDHGQTEVGEVGGLPPGRPTSLSARRRALPQTAHSHLFGIGRMWIWI